MTEYESRAYAAEIEPSGDGRSLDGYVAVFNSRARIPDRGGDFEEEIKPGAFDRSLRENGVPVLQWDHGKDPRVGTVPIGKWTEWRRDGKGYRVAGRLFDNPVVEPVRQAIANEAVSGLSFRFKVSKGGDKWERRHGGMDLRHVIDCDVHEAGPVVFPAYRDARVSLRNLFPDMSSEELQDSVYELRHLAGMAVELDGEDFQDDEDRDDDEYDERSIVLAYATTWHGVTEQRAVDGGTVRTRNGRHCLDEWLTAWRADGSPPLPVLRDHHPNLVVGHLRNAWTDEHGLMVEAQLHNTDEGCRALSDIHSGALKGFSVNLAVLSSTDADDDGVAEVRTAVLRECGPVDQPFDRGARILTVGGVGIEDRAGFDTPDEFFDYVRMQTGVDSVALVEEQARSFARGVATTVGYADSLSREIAKLQRKVDEEYRGWVRYKRGDGFRRAQDADHVLVGLMAELTDVLTSDRDLVHRSLRSAGADPGFRSPLRSVRTMLDYGLGRR